MKAVKVTVLSRLWEIVEMEEERSEDSEALQTQDGDTPRGEDCDVKRGSGMCRSLAQAAVKRIRVQCWV